MRRFKLAFAFALFLVPLTPFIQSAQAQTTGFTWNGITGADDSTWDGSDPYPGFSWIWHEALSGDGRFVTFWSSKSNLVPADVNGFTDAFVRDRFTQHTEIVSLATDGSPANEASSHPTISVDGRHVAFRSCATNLVVGDTNARCDVFVRDRLTGITSRVNVGPAGEQARDDESFFFSLSADGRYVAFIATFTWSFIDRHVWLRDRDADGNGVFDEPGTATTTRISVPTVGNAQLWNSVSVTISGNGRFVAYTAVAMQDGMNGEMLFAHDRETGMTMRIDVPTAGLPDVPGYSYWPDLDHEGRYLVYTSDAPHLVEGDGDSFSDLFLFNLQTGGNIRLGLTHADAPALQGSWTPSISGDGRYVAFMGAANVNGTFVYQSFGIDRQVGSYEISGNADGTPDVSGNGGITSVSADGSSIAFGGSWNVVNDPPPSGQIFVAIELALSPTTIDVPSVGGNVTIDVSAPANTPWQVRGFFSQIVESLGATAGVGIGSVMATVFPNNSGLARDLFVYVGSERVRIHQTVVPVVSSVMPPFGPITGGTVVQILGQGFAPGAAVLIGGAPATDVSVLDSMTIQATTGPQTWAGPADVMVMNSDGSIGRLEGAFIYEDSTPPVIIPVLTGTLGDNGWYTSDVVLSWIVSDPQSETWHDCQPVTYSFDSAFHMGSCTAQSAGGTATGSVEFKRDATVPQLALLSPAAGSSFSRGQQVVASYSCDDPSGGSGVAQCNGQVPSGSALNTSQAGSFTFTVTAQDAAGNEASAVASYTVAKSVPVVTWQPSASIGYGTVLSAAQLNASADVAGSFTYTPSIGAVLPGGVHTLSVTFTPADSANYHSASASVGLTVTPAALTVRANNSSKVYGEALPGFTATVTGFVAGDSVASLAGALSFSTSATTTSAPGSYGVVPSGVSSPNYAIAFVPGSLTIAKASTATALTTNPNPSGPQKPVQITATVAAVAPGAGMPTGSVQFVNNGTVLGTATLVNGVATITKSFKKGTHTLTATYSGDGNFTGSANTAVHQVR